MLGSFLEAQLIRFVKNRKIYISCGVFIVVVVRFFFFFFDLGPDLMCYFVPLRPSLLSHDN